jgi:PIN domain nuclease of toxin-antitoxin system
MAGGRTLILLDTCTLLWLVGTSDQLPASVHAALQTAHGGIHVSAISAFEIGQKHALGKLSLARPPADWWTAALARYGLRELPLDSATALAATALPRLHPDPFDRLLIATAQRHRLTLLTPDPKIRAYPQLKTLW